MDSRACPSAARTREMTVNVVEPCILCKPDLPCSRLNTGAIFEGNEREQIMYVFGKHAKSNTWQYTENALTHLANSTILMETLVIHMGESTMWMPMKIESFEWKPHSIRIPCIPLGKGIHLMRKPINQHSIRKPISLLTLLFKNKSLVWKTTFRRVVVRVDYRVSMGWCTEITETYLNKIWFWEKVMPKDNQGKWLAPFGGPCAVPHGRIQIFLECICNS